MDETYKFNPSETLNLYQSSSFILVGIMLMILLVILLHHEVGYLELLILQWYMNLTNIMVPHFRSNLYTRARLVYQKGGYQTNVGHFLCFT
jgi:hypothetical protein